MDSKLKKFLDSGEYLPDFMEDFHDQKNLFHLLDEVVKNRDEDYTKDVNWVAAQVYTVDIFLWFMACNGYTLQKSRKRVPFYDIHKELNGYEKKRREQQANILKQAFAQNNSK